MVCCNNDDLAWEIRSVRDHGYDVKEKLNLLQMEGKQLYIHRRVGYNFRMTEIQSAIGLGELRRFDKWNLPQRKKLGKALMKGLEGHPLVKYAPVDTKDRQNAFWLVPFVLDTSKLKCTILHARPHQGGRRRVQEGRQGDDEVTGSPAKEKGREDAGLPAFFGIIRRR